MPLYGLQHAMNVFALHVGQRGEFARIGSQAWRIGDERKVARLNASVSREKNRPLHDVAQLANVPRPAISRQGVTGILSERWRVRAAKALQEVLREQQNVGGPFSKRRKRYGDTVDAEV